jgi:hypothetical protein
MLQEDLKYDVAVIGGGLAGVCAGIAAARDGARTVLLHNRPVLGGHSSSEIRVWVRGANGFFHNRFGRESGLIGELLVENQYRNPLGNVFLWDSLLLERVRRERDLTVHLLTDVRSVACDQASGCIRSVTAWTMGAERVREIAAEIFVDCSGDGLIGHLAGAESRTGREAISEFGEPWAQPQADQKSLGTSMFFVTKDAGRAVPFVAPSFAKDIRETTIPLSRIKSSRDSGADYWWIEYGGNLDTIHDHEDIQKELLAVIYGIWDYIKNSGEFRADTMTLEWVGYLPAKRESRRLIGDHILTQNEVVWQREFPDNVGFGGWSVDLHDPDGMYAQGTPDKHMFADGLFQIPLGSLYSRNIPNLLFAGRNASATHAGLGAIRVMGTCAVMGEAVGAAAALCVHKGIKPRALRSRHASELQQVLLRHDASIVGVRNQDGNDLALRAHVSCSSSLSRLAIENPTTRVRLEQDVSFLLPLEPANAEVEVLLDADANGLLTVELYDVERPENYVPHVKRFEHQQNILAGMSQWVRIPLGWRPASLQNTIIVLRADPVIHLHLSDDLVPGVLAFRRMKNPLPKWYSRDNTNSPPPKLIEWDMRDLHRRAPCMRVAGDTPAYVSGNVINGFPRPYGGPNLWVSAPEDERPWLALSWRRPITARRVLLTFNDDVNERLDNLWRYETPFRIFPELVRDYDIEARMGSTWEAVASVRCNRSRRRTHELNPALRLEELKISVLATNGSRYAQVFEVRVY